MAVTQKQGSFLPFYCEQKRQLKILRESNKLGWEDHKKIRKDVVPVETVKEIHTFFNGGDISKDLLRKVLDSFLKPPMRSIQKCMAQR